MTDNRPDEHSAMLMAHLESVGIGRLSIPIRSSMTKAILPLLLVCPAVVKTGVVISIFCCRDAHTHLNGVL